MGKNIDWAHGDDLGDLLGGAPAPKQLPQDDASARIRATVEANSAAPGFWQNCPKCHGSGSFTSYTGRTVGQCFACKGTKGKHVKTDPAIKQRRAAATAQAKAAKLEEFKRANADIWQYLQDRAHRWSFAADMVAKLDADGELTTGQYDAVVRAMARDEDRAQQRVAAAATAPAVDTAGVDRLKAAFDKAIATAAAKGLKKSPRITIGGMTIKPAKANSKNPGALYVTLPGAENDYLGKIADGRFYASRDCTPAQAAQVQTFVADPAAAAKVYGQETGTCCICNATLRSEWRLKGIGPICAANFGF